MQARPDFGVDPIQLEVVKNALLAVTEEQSVALQRAAYSTNIKTRRDYSCSLLDRNIRGVAQAFAQPTHLAAMAYAVPNALAMYGVDRLEPGDGILTNIPHFGSTHLNDMALITPCFWKDAVVGYLVNFAHHVDVGGGAPGSIAMGRDIYQEGIVVPPIRFVRNGEIDESCFELIRWNVRSKREVAGDFRAQLAANNVGVQRLTELLERYGADELERYSDALLAYTEHRTLACFKDLPDGRHQPYGLAGGKSGTPSFNILNPGADQKILPVLPRESTELKKGDSVRHIQPGAGGYGDPLMRDPQLVLEDVRDEKLSINYVKREYGVVIDARTMTVNEPATRRLRKRKAAAGQRPQGLASHVAHFVRSLGLRLAEIGVSRPPSMRRP